MSLDEQLQRAFDALADRLRDDISRELQRVSGELQQTAAAERERVVAESAEAAEAARRDVEALATARVEHAVGEAERRSAARLADAVAAAEQRAEAFGREAGREEALADADARVQAAVEAALASARASSPGADAAAIARLIDAVRTIDRARSLTDVLDTLVGCATREARRVALLLVRGVDLHGWRFAGFDPPVDDASGVRLDIGQSGIAADAVRTNKAVVTDSGPTPPFAPLDAGRLRVAVPMALAGQPVAVLYADQGSEAAAEAATTWAALVEVMTEHAARTLEARTAFMTARALTEQPASPVASTAHETVDPAPVARNDRDDEAAAQRYAKLLVSEIKLYHEQDVVAGRRERDLLARVGGEIARARSLYEQRVPEGIRARTDYFGAELVRMLADGDESLLKPVGR